MKNNIYNLMSSKVFTFLFLLCVLHPLASGYVFFEHGTNNESKIIYNLFGDLAHSFYVDIGAYDPIFASNTLNLYSAGWDGVNIEANPDRLNRFYMSRADQINLNYAVGKEDVFVTLY